MTVVAGTVVTVVVGTVKCVVVDAVVVDVVEEAEKRSTPLKSIPSSKKIFCHEEV